CLRSAGRCQGMRLSRPMTRLAARAAIRARGGRVAFMGRENSRATRTPAVRRDADAFTQLPSFRPNDVKRPSSIRAQSVLPHPGDVDMARTLPSALRQWITACSLLLPLAASAAPLESRIADALQLNKPRTEAAPLIIAHRGASGYLPEHTLAAYAVAILQGADYVEPDLVMTRDGQLVARHDNQLGLTTDVAQRPEFASRKRTQSIDGQSQTGWFSEDFTLAEIKTLRAIERIPQLRPGNQRLDGAFEIPTLQEIIELVQAMQASEGRIIGLYPETKHPTHFQQIGLAMEKPLVRTLHRNGYLTPNAPVYIQSFEVDNLKTLKRLTKLRLVQLFGSGQ